MKRKSIWLLGIVIGVLSVVLLYMQWRNADQMVRMREDQFNESVLRSLDMAAHDLERDETMRYLEAVASMHEQELDSIAQKGGAPVSPDLPPAVFQDSVIMFQPQQVAPLSTKLPNTFLMHPQSFKDEKSKSFLETVKNAYLYKRTVLDEVIYTILYNASEHNLEDRVDCKMLDNLLAKSLRRNGVNIPFHFRLETSDGREVFRCFEYDSIGSDYTYTQTLFRNDPSDKMGVVQVHFPDRGKYIWNVARKMTPMMLFTLLLLLVFWYTIYQLSRQKKISEMKNDFVNNMTHEFKTPLSSISLAAQMLADKSVTKTPAMYDNLSKTIKNESDRLRFQVEKVLQMSLFDHDNFRVKSDELDMNDLVENVVNTLQLRIKQLGGEVDLEIESYDPFVYGDDMHLTNVIFNLMDNAVKYRNHDVNLHLRVKTENVGDNLQITIQDNGIGIKSADLGHIFERFYRVHTGNQHDVKGFGLGLAYVHTIIELHHGRIKAESEFGKGTTFIITLPSVKD